MKKVFCYMPGTINAKALGAALKIIKSYFIHSLTISSVVTDQNQQWHVHSARVTVAGREFRCNSACLECGFQDGNKTWSK